MEKTSQLAIGTIAENEDVFEAIDYLNRLMCEAHLELFYKYLSAKERLDKLIELIRELPLDDDIKTKLFATADYSEDDRMFGITYNEFFQE